MQLLGVQAPASFLLFCSSEQAFVLIVHSGSKLAAGLYPPCLPCGLEGGRGNRALGCASQLSQLTFISLLSSPSRPSFFHLIGQNLVSLPHLVLREAGKCTIYSGQQCDELQVRPLLLMEKRKWILGGSWCVVSATENDPSSTLDSFIWWQ